MALKPVTDDQWEKVNDKNKDIVSEFLTQSTTLSDYTLKQYESGLRIYFNWIKENKDNKNFWEIKSRDFLHFQNWLINEGLSSNAVRFKRSCVSTLNNYITLYYQEEYPMFHNYINKGIALPPHELIRDKNPLSLNEYEELCRTLKERELWQQLAYIRFSFATGARRNEVRQLTKEMLKIPPKELNVDGNITKIYSTGKIRCKGRGKAGKIRTLQYDEAAFDAINEWLNFRGDDDCEYVFIVKKPDGKVSQVGETIFNQWGDNYFEEIIGRRFHPHILRESRATSLVVEQGKDIEIAKKLLGHESSETTQIYIIRNDEDDSDDAFV